MTDERDGIDPADWLASQFGEEPETPPAKKPDAAPPATPPARTPVVPPAVALPPSAPPPADPADEGAGFPWSLTPGASAPELPTPTPPPLVLPPEPTVDWDTPTVASPVLSAAEPPATVALPGAEVARREFPGAVAPVDSAIDSLFGAGSFVEYGDEPLIPAPPARAPGVVAVVERAQPKAPVREPIPRVQKILMWVAGGLVAALALVALFLLGTRIAQSSPAAPPVVPSSSATSSAPPADGALPAGPLQPGEYAWNQLLGGECLAPYESPWQDSYTVVDCAQAHQGQMVHRGVLPDAADAAYPGVDELQKQAVALCAVPTIIDYTAVGSTTDLQISASFAADEQDWLGGNRTFFCFASRTGGAELTGSIAMPAQ